MVFEDAALTYAQLDARANQLAHHLQSLGVGPEVVVGLCVERSLEMMVGLLGILKAGGAYLPLDPAYPPERLAFMLEDAARAGAAHPMRRCANGLPRITVPHRPISTPTGRPSRKSRRRPAQRLRPANTAYIIYTSGSTGKPKGVVIDACEARNNLVSLGNDFSLGVRGTICHSNFTAIRRFDSEQKILP